MNNLINKFFFAVIFLAIISLSCSAQTSKETSRCVENILNIKVARVDENNHRLFIADKNIKALNIKSNLAAIEKCFVNTSWQSDWALSVFTEAKFAGYKDEDAIIPYHQNNLWAKSYILEYDHATKTLITNPVLNPKKFKF